MKTEELFLEELTTAYPIDLEDATKIYEAAGKDYNHANRAAVLALYGVNTENIIYFLKAYPEVFRDAAVPEELLRAYQCNWTSQDFQEIQQQYMKIASIIDDQGIEAALLDPEKATIVPEMTDDPILREMIMALKVAYKKFHRIVKPYREGSF
ncbi:hypothetical protein G3M81_12455 [Bacillus paralicheniformis]|uniref:hypothetical protein n=1 Tax=Bacillus TaxID=1386 RepID=UPI0013EF230F|nr:MULTISPECIES: hypothetical protein [Bacillus]MCY8609915.1 hypothetical protein [Bacillus haynesii]MEC0752150.1 hypothetical protein [Bacillus haynesii]QII49501.1 hypothetical protein G3M81_12455 [Bacillus paralicheniformis]